MWKLPIAPLAGEVSRDGYAVLSFGTKALLFDPFGEKVSEFKCGEEYIIKDVGVIGGGHLEYFVLLAQQFKDGFPGVEVSVYFVNSSKETEVSSTFLMGFNYHGRGSYVAVWDSNHLHVIHKDDGLVWKKRNYGRIFDVYVNSYALEVALGVASEKYIALLDEDGDSIWRVRTPKHIEEISRVVVIDNREIGVAYADPSGTWFIGLFSEDGEIWKMKFPYGKVLDLDEEFVLGELGFMRWYYHIPLPFEEGEHLPEDMIREMLERMKFETPIPKAERGKILAGNILLLKRGRAFELFYPYGGKSYWRSGALEVKGNWNYLMVMGPGAELLSLPETIYGDVNVPIMPDHMVVSDYGKVALVYELIRGFIVQVFSKDGKKIMEKRYRGGKSPQVKFCGDDLVVLWSEGFTHFAEFKDKVVNLGIASIYSNVFDCSSDGRTVALLSGNVVSVLVDGELRWAREIENSSDVFVSREGNVIYVMAGDELIAFSKRGKKLLRHRIPESVGDPIIILERGVLFEVSFDRWIVVDKEGIKPLKLSIISPEIKANMTKYGFSFDFDTEGFLLENKSRYKIYDITSRKTYIVPKKERIIYGPVLSLAGRYLAYINENYSIAVIEIEEGLESSDAG